MRQATGYDGETIVDVENLLVKELRRRGIINVTINEKKGLSAWDGAAGGADRDEAEGSLSVGDCAVGGKLSCPPFPFHF